MVSVTMIEHYRSTSSIIPSQLLEDKTMSLHNLGTISDRTTFNNRVTALVDPLDSLQFSLARAGNLNIGVSGLTQNVRLQLFRSSSSGLTRIGSSNYRGTTPESLNFRGLQRGQYVAQIQLLAPGRTPYRMRLSRQLINDVIAEERTWNSVNTNLSAYQGTLGTADTSDMFRLNLGADTPLSLTLTGALNTARLRLVKDKNNNGFIDSGEVLASSSAGNLEKSLNIRNLSQGNYHIQVCGSANTPYTLGMAPQSNFAVREFDLGTLGDTIVTRTGSVHDFNTSDIYSFTLADARHVSLALTGFAGDPDLRIARDANGNGLIETPEMISYSSRRQAGIDESITLNHLAAGTYLVQVTQHAGTSNYTMRLSTGYPTDLLPTEYDLGVINGTRTLSQYIGSGMYYQNAADNIRFTLNSTRSVNLTLSGLSCDIDLRLVHDANNNGVVDTGEVLGSSANGSDGAEWIAQSLPAGTYFAQVYRWMSHADDSNYNFSVSTGDWYSSNLTDAGIIGEARYFDTRNYSRRYEVMTILRAAKDYGNIDGAELTDLRTFVNGQSTTMPDYVHNLAYKVVNSNPANQWWTGGASTRTSLGNLYAGATADHLEKLIGKWFLGLDHPTAASTTTYRYTSGALFQNGIAYQDVVQGGLGDCYFCASIAGTAFRNPSTIQNMFIDNGDGTFTVRFYNNGVADYVTVDRYLPSTAAGGRYYMAWGGGLYNNTSNELWAALAEKAYAQVNESGWLGRGDSSNTYAALDGGTLSAISHVTGLSNTGYLPLSSSEIISAHNNNRIVYFSDGGHAYTLVGYSPTLGYQIYNPHGTTSWYSWAQVQATFVRWGYSGVRIPGAV